MNPDKPRRYSDQKEKIMNFLDQSIPVNYETWINILRDMYGELNISNEQEDKELWTSFLQKGIDTAAHFIQNAPVFSTVKEYFQWYRENIQDWMAVLDRMIEPTAGTDIETIKRLLDEMVTKVIKPLKEKEGGFVFTPPAQSPADRALMLVSSTMNTFVREG